MVSRVVSGTLGTLAGSSSFSPSSADMSEFCFRKMVENLVSGLTVPLSGMMGGAKSICISRKLESIFARAFAFNEYASSSSFEHCIPPLVDIIVDEMISFVLWEPARERQNLVVSLRAMSAEPRFVTHSTT